MLVCDQHHRVFDREMVAEHPADVLMAMKRRHEDRIRTVTAIDEDSDCGPLGRLPALGELNCGLLETS